MTDPYAVLGVSRTASAAEITRAYRRKLRDYHPDTRRGDADDRLQEVLAAYAALRRTRSDAPPSTAVRIPVRHGRR
ncbi:J domain-containing protein [Mycobacterium sp. MYCO198283]|uniref:J domain-containing protein n=1 Tax=Mycobacterium sp. MYCO198283 TaxID=2883505 RepID=UPI001E43DB23|nr:J domain-containing protein [Mycobacterium sp. MYCO198283]MCG5432387.1 J domain-containing protein [Mycobacterium sp. MYCO198283]